MLAEQYLGFDHVASIFTNKAAKSYDAVERAVASFGSEVPIDPRTSNNMEVFISALFLTGDAPRATQRKYIDHLLDTDHEKQLEKVIKTILDYSNPDNHGRFCSFYDIGHNPYHDGYASDLLTFIDNIADEPSLWPKITPTHIFYAINYSIENMLIDNFSIICDEKLYQKLTQEPLSTGSLQMSIDASSGSTEELDNAISLAVSRGIIDTMVNPRLNNLGEGKSMRTANHERHMAAMNTLYETLGVFKIHSTQKPVQDIRTLLEAGLSSTDFANALEAPHAQTAQPKSPEQLSPFQKRIFDAIQRGTSQGVGTLLYNGQGSLLNDFISNARDQYDSDDYSDLIRSNIEDAIKDGITEAAQLARNNNASGNTLDRSYPDGHNIDLYDEPLPGDLTFEHLKGLTALFERFPEYEKAFKDIGHLPALNDMLTLDEMT